MERGHIVQKLNPQEALIHRSWCYGTVTIVSKAAADPLAMTPMTPAQYNAPPNLPHPATDAQIRHTWVLTLKWTKHWAENGDVWSGLKTQIGSIQFYMVGGN